MTGCWTRKYQKWAGKDEDDITPFGLCSYFEKLNKPAKEIPAEIVDKGCKFKEAK